KTNVSVTEETFTLYRKLIILHSIRTFTDIFLSIRKGIHQMLPSIIQQFTPSDLKNLLNGTKIDVVDWKANTDYNNCHPEDKLIKWFWEIVEDMDQKKR